jgi:hypothetical protein
MAERTVRLYGKVWGDPASPASITVLFDGEPCYQGPVNTVSGALEPDVVWSDMTVLATWPIALDVVGAKSMSFTVNDGDAVVQTLHANYMGAQVTSWQFVAAQTWPSYQPASADEVAADRLQLDDAAFVAKYGLTKSQARTQIEPAVIIPTEQNWNDLTGASTLQSDGRDNVVIAGVAQTRTVTSNQLGKWNWPVLSGQTLTCDVQVIPAVL